MSVNLLTRWHPRMYPRPRGSVIEPETEGNLGIWQCTVVEDEDEYLPPVQEMPAYLGTYIDATYGALVTRISGTPEEAIPTAGGTWTANARPGYGTRPVWDADGTRMLLERGAAEGWLFLDGNNYAPLYLRTGSYPWDARWSATMPGVMMYVDIDGDIGIWTTDEDNTTVFWDTSEYYDLYMGGPDGANGGFSSDDSAVAVHATRVSDDKIVAFAVTNLFGDVIKTPDIDLVAEGFTYVDYVMIDSTGQYIIVNGAVDGTEDINDNTKIYDLTGTQIQFWDEYGVPSHFDTGTDVDGLPVAVGVAKSGTYDGRVIMRRLATGEITPLTSDGYANQTSCRNTGNPHWAYITHADDSYPFHREVFAVELKAGGRIVRIAHFQNYWYDYDSEGHCVVSPNGLKVAWGSNWNDETGTDPIRAYVADLGSVCVAA